MIRDYAKQDLELCASLIIEVYNGPPWNNRWTPDAARRYVAQFTASADFAGWVIEADGRAVGALLAHRHAWWRSDELHIDELFVSPDFQRRGYGRALLRRAQAHCLAQGLSALTLLTDRRMPAGAFYENNGYILSEHTAFLYKPV